MNVIKPLDFYDFKDVAENYDLYFDIISSNKDRYNGFLEFYLDLAKQYGQKGCIDLGCGTGAVAIHLAKNGIQCDGLDISPIMCEIAKNNAKKENVDVNIYPTDVVDFNVDRKYSFALIARSGFMQISTAERQRGALNAIYEHLEPGGILAFDMFDPLPYFNLYQLKKNEDQYELFFEYVNYQGYIEKISRAVSYDPDTQKITCKWKFETYKQGGEKLTEIIRPLIMRMTYQQELMYLVELCGFKILDIYHDFYKNKEHTDESIWVLQKK